MRKWLLAFSAVAVFVLFVWALRWTADAVTGWQRPIEEHMPAESKWLHQWYSLTFDVAIGRMTEDEALRRLEATEPPDIREYRLREYPGRSVPDAYRAKFRRRVDLIQEGLPGR